MSLILSFLDNQAESALDWAFDRLLDRVEDESEVHDRLVRVATDALLDRIEDDPDFARRFIRILGRIDRPIHRPPAPTARLIREEPDNMLVFETEVPPAPGATDVVLREVEVVVDDGTPEVLDVTAGPAEFSVPEGGTFTLRYRETDDAGNVGEWSDPFTDTAVDTIAPPKPGVIGARLVREEDDDDADDADDAGDSGEIDAGTGGGTINPAGTL